MYIRWQSRKRKSQFGSYRDLELAWRAVLVESVRVDGKPTQRHIGYLVGFTESAIATPAQQRFVWDRIEARLARIGNRITAEDRETIIASIAEKIGPPPTREQREELDRQREAFLGAFKFAFSNKLRRRPRKRPRTAP
jgi:hypothetical protein